MADWLRDTMMCTVIGLVSYGCTQSPYMTSSTAGAYVPVNPLSLAFRDLPRLVTSTFFYPADGTGC